MSNVYGYNFHSPMHVCKSAVPNCLKYELFVNGFYPIYIKFSVLMQCVIQIHTLTNESKRNGSIGHP